MEKQFIKVEALHKTSSDGPIPVDSDILSQINSGDIINAGYEEPFYSENNSHDGYFYFVVTRKRLETEEEFEKRVEEINSMKEKSKKRRYETYLQLKEEFEEDK